MGILLTGIRNRELNAEKIESELYNECVKVTEDIKVRTRKTAVSVSGAPGQASLGKCPKCGSDVVTGKFGAYCTGKCGISLGKIYGNKVTDAQMKKLLKGDSVEIKGLKSKKGTTYNAVFKIAGTEPYEYTNKEGKTVKGWQVKYDMSFPERKSNK